MEYTSLPDSYVDGRKVSNRILADNGWSNVTTSVNTGRSEKYVIGRKTSGSTSCNVWTSEPLVQSDLDELDTFRSSPYWLSGSQTQVKDQAKQTRDILTATEIFAALQYPDDYETFESARAALLSEYAYLNGKDLQGQQYIDRKLQLEELFEWINLISAELRALKPAIDDAADQAALDAINVTFTPGPSQQ